MCSCPLVLYLFTNFLEFEPDMLQTVEAWCLTNISYRQLLPLAQLINKSVSRKQVTHNKGMFRVVSGKIFSYLAIYITLFAVTDFPSSPITKTRNQ